MTTRSHRQVLLPALLLLAATGVPPAGAYRDHPPPPPPFDGPPLPPPTVYVVPQPPPPSPAMRAIYAPFYGAGLLLHYGWRYGVEAPIAIFHHALHYGVDDDHR